MKIGTIILVVVLLIVAYLVGSFANSDKAEIESLQTQVADLQQKNNQLALQVTVPDMSLEINKCISTLQISYRQDSISNDTIIIGFKEGYKEELIEAVRNHNLTTTESVSASAPYFYATTKVGEVIKQICILSQDENIQIKARYMTPNPISYTTS